MIISCSRITNNCLHLLIGCSLWNTTSYRILSVRDLSSCCCNISKEMDTISYSNLKIFWIDSDFYIFQIKSICIVSCFKNCFLINNRLFNSRLFFFEFFIRKCSSSSEHTFCWNYCRSINIYAYEMIRVSKLIILGYSSNFTTYSKHCCITITHSIKWLIWAQLIILPIKF